MHSPLCLITRACLLIWSNEWCERINTSNRSTHIKCMQEFCSAFMVFVARSEFRVTFRFCLFICFCFGCCCFFFIQFIISLRCVCLFLCVRSLALYSVWGRFASFSSSSLLLFSIFVQMRKLQRRKSALPSKQYQNK